MKQSVYALYVSTGHKKHKEYFYVGKSINVLRRVKQHHYRTNHGHEDLYQYLRDLRKNSVKWEYEILKVIPTGEYPPDNERWFVIKLTRDGHRLMNMRYGNEEKRREIAEQVKSPHIRSVKDVEADRKSRCYQMSKKVRRRVLLQTLKNEGIPDLKTDRLIPHYLRNRLLQEGIYCVSKGVEINDLISFCRPRGKVRKMLELLNGLT